MATRSEQQGGYRKRKQPSRATPFLLAIGITVGAIVLTFLLFTLTRTGPNYREEQFTPDPPAQTSQADAAPQVLA